MSFTDRYIKVPVKIVDRKMQEMNVPCEEEDSFIKINPLQIVKYRPTYDDVDSTKKEIVSLVDTLGDVTLVYMSFNEFETMLNKHMGK